MLSPSLVPFNVFALSSPNRNLFGFIGLAMDIPCLGSWTSRGTLQGVHDIGMKVLENFSPIKPMLPNKPRGVRRANDRRVLNGIFWVLRSGAPWRDLPETYGPRITCYNRFEIIAC